MGEFKVNSANSSGRRRDRNGKINKTSRGTRTSGGSDNGGANKTLVNNLERDNRANVDIVEGLEEVLSRGKGIGTRCANGHDIILAVRNRNVANRREGIGQDDSRALGAIKEDVTLSENAATVNYSKIRLNTLAIKS